MAGKPPKVETTAPVQYTVPVKYTSPAHVPSANPRRSDVPGNTPGRPRQPDNATSSGTTATRATAGWP